MSGNHNKNHFAAAYIRVSTENQTELSPSSQLKIIRKFADEKGYLIDEDFIFVTTEFREDMPTSDLNLTE